MKKYIRFILILILIINICIILNIFLSNKISKSTYASSEISNEISSDNIIYDIQNQKSVNSTDLIQIINESVKNTITEEIVVEQIDIEYITKYENNPSLAKGTIQVIQEGRDGLREIIVKKVLIDENVIKEELIADKTIKASINKIVQIGTANYTNNYKVKLGDKLYVTSNTLSLKYEPTKESDKIATIYKNDEVIVLEISNDFCKIRYKSIEGWVSKDTLTNINPNTNQNIDTTGSENTKQQLLAKLSFSMSLNKPSGLSINQFKKVLSGYAKDVNNIFSQNAEYFYYIEKQYNINGIFVAAVAIHESNWGTSKIARDKNNLFGYGAYDGDAYNSAYSFSSYSEGIDLIARVFVKYYLNKSGTSTYNGQTASGKYYNGSTLSGVNTKYASDKNWANSVYKWMEYLYNRL